MPADREEKPATSADVEALLTEMEKVRAKVASLRGQPGWPAPGVSGAAPLPIPPPPEQLVTLDQIGAIVHRSKRTMERYRSQMPAPRTRGRRGQPHLWAWAEVRPWLESPFGLRLPEHFPGHTN